MRTIYITLCLIPLLFSQCSSDDMEVQHDKVAQPVFPKEAEAFGKAVAENIRFTAKAISKDPTVDYTNRVQIDKLTRKYSTNFLKSKGYAITRSMESEPDIDLFVSKIQSFSNVQNKVLERISQANLRSKSYEEFMLKLVEINDYIVTNVSNIEQKRLLMVTAAIYYGTKEIQVLTSEGYLPKQPSLNRIKTRNETTSGSIGQWCSSGLSTVWLAAAVEPTPFGEIIATGASAIVGCILLYEFIVKCTSSSSNSLSRDECIDLYVDCKQAGKLLFSKCQDCYDYCYSQGIWNCPRPY